MSSSAPAVDCDFVLATVVSEANRIRGRDFLFDCNSNVVFTVQTVRGVTLIQQNCGIAGEDRGRDLRPCGVIGYRQ